MGTMHTAHHRKQPQMETLEAVLSSAGNLPWNIDVAQRQIVFARLRPSDYRSLSFLDQRLQSVDPQLLTLPIETVIQACQPLLADNWRLGFIFHIGHCGSTLLSRVLGEHPTVLALREPLVLKTLAEQQRQLGRPEAFMDTTAL